MKWLAALALIVCTNMAHAERDGLSATSEPLWKEECGSCHIAYPPQLLAAEDWKQIMNGLDKHFGANASMDAKDARDILEFLQRHAGKQDGRHSSSSLRISDTTWFKREHREVSSRSWLDPSVKSRSNCKACHVRAEQGDWSEHSIIMPGGLRMEDDD
jgi:hypothetical protein